MVHILLIILDREILYQANKGAKDVDIDISSEFHYGDFIVILSGIVVPNPYIFCDMSINA